MLSLVIAKYNEDLSWINELPKDIKINIIEKGKDLENIGREASSYVFFVLRNYEKLEGDYIFCQGYPFDHDLNFIQNVKKEIIFGKLHSSFPNGCPEHCGLDLHSSCEKLNIPKEDEYKFIAGAQFKLSAEKIKRRKKSEWFDLYYQLISGQIDPWSMERLWFYWLSKK